MNNWKTTATGALTILGGLVAAAKLWIAGDMQAAVTALLMGVSTGLGLIAAKDATAQK